MNSGGWVRVGAEKIRRPAGAMGTQPLTKNLAAMLPLRRRPLTIGLVQR
jgi:hypothetical protein